jgi:serine/threonine-protein kinase
VAGALIGAWLLLRPTPLPQLEGRSLVVLPSRDLSGAPGGQLVGDALAETLSARLGQVPGIQVVTPSFAVAAADRQSDPFAAARSVGAALAVGSSIMRSGDTVRIAYQVWNVGKRSQVASGTVDGPASDLFGVQDRLAASVAAGLDADPQLTASRTKVASGLDSAAAQEQYLQAIGHLQREDKSESLDQAILLLDGLAARHADSPLVFAALGRGYLGRFRLTKERSWAERAIVAAETARRLDPTVAEVDVTLGQTLLATGQGAQAEEAFRRALATDPGNAGALVGLASAREAAGDSAGAEASLRRAIELHPYAFAPYSQLGSFYFAKGRYADAADVFRRQTGLTPDSYQAYSNLGGALSMSCDFTGATEAYSRALELKPEFAPALSNLGMNQVFTGRYTEAVRLLEHASKASPGDFMVWGNLADAYRASGRATEAKPTYERTIALAREAIRLNAGNPPAHSFLASALAKTGHPDEAAASMQRALDLAGNDPNVLLDAAIVALLGGRRSEAVDFAAAAVESGYCPSLVADSPDLAPLRSEPRFRAIASRPPAATGS